MFWLVVATIIVVAIGFVGALGSVVITLSLHSSTIRASAEQAIGWILNTIILLGSTYILAQATDHIVAKWIFHLAIVFVVITGALRLAGLTKDMFGNRVITFWWGVAPLYFVMYVALTVMAVIAAVTTSV